MVSRRARFSLPDRRRVYRVLDEGVAGDPISRWVDRALVILIIFNVLAVVLESAQEISAAYGSWFRWFEIVSVAIFSVEYALRVWVAPEYWPGNTPNKWRARLAWMKTPAALIDLAAIAPFYLSLFLPFDLRFLRIFRLVRFLKLARYSAGLRSLARAVYAERRALAASFIIMVGLILTSASLAYLAENAAQPDKFGSIPAAMWWAVATLTTVGYGDVVPVTAFGKLLGGFVMLIGFATFALPVGIVATAFSSEIHRRDFVVTWTMIARVPLFGELDAGEIADIMSLLHARTAIAGEVIARKGDPAHSMYFIVNGAVQVDLESGPVTLSEGDFFGEVALLRKATRSATVTASVRTSLLVLDADALHALMDRQPDIAKRLREVMRERLGPERITPRGDIVAEEIVPDE